MVCGINRPADEPSKIPAAKRMNKIFGGRKRLTINDEVDQVNKNYKSKRS
jgi:hypothetical protein